MSASSMSKGHVYFGCEDHVPKDNRIVIKQSSLNQVQIHLGFLQFQYMYSITVNIPKCYFLGYDMESVLKAAENSIPNINCKIISIKEKVEDYEVVAEFLAQKERLLKEEIKLCLDDNVEIRIEFYARVLGPGKGTPLLKNGIKCIGVLRDELSEASDWQG